MAEVVIDIVVVVDLVVHPEGVEVPVILATSMVISHMNVIRTMTERRKTMRKKRCIQNLAKMIKSKSAYD